LRCSAASGTMLRMPVEAADAIDLTSLPAEAAALIERL
jgi:hypothetical protein